ncbi:MAG: ABC transporter permease [Candidatus Hydrothermarchaeaceae archaeon]
MREYIEYPIKSLSQQKARTFLTLLGIVIGIAVIVAMLSIGKGMDVSINQQLEKMGADKISIFPAGISFGPLGPSKEFVPFSLNELEEVRRISGVESAVPYFMRAGTVEYRNEKKETTINGGTRKGVDIFRKFYLLKEGRYFKDEESDAVNIGYRVSKDFFDNEVGVGDVLKIQGKKFKVVGVFEEIGNVGDDTAIYMPIKVAQKLFGAENEITAIFAVAENEEIVNKVAMKIEDLLEKIRGSKDFEIMTTEQMAEEIGNITKIITFVLGGIASVSLVVGGVIIMNTMLVSVLERTREIGIMKATGATNSQVLRLFLTESSLVGLSGGMLGIILGTLISKLIEVVGKSYIGGSFITVIDLRLVVGALLFSLAVGSISGVYPAWRASRLNPVDALRYE